MNPPTEPPAFDIAPVTIEEEMKRSYLDYAMSVIIGRALPDIRDGLKPANRRVLYGMQQMGLQPGRPYKKSAKIVGEVMGNYHPHGGEAIYDTLVRMAQPFSPSYHSSHQPSRIERLSPPLSADFIPDVPQASNGRSGLFSQTSQPG